MFEDIKRNMSKKGRLKEQLPVLHLTVVPENKLSQTDRSFIEEKHNASNNPNPMTWAITAVNVMAEINTLAIDWPHFEIASGKINDSISVGCVTRRCFTYQLPLVHLEPARDAGQTLDQSQSRPFHPQTLQLRYSTFNPVIFFLSDFLTYSVLF